MNGNPFDDVLRVTTRELDRLGIVYAVTGSIASGLYGEPLPSQDVDIVLRVTIAQANALQAALPRRLFRNPDRLAEIAGQGGLANLIDTDTGLKVDLSIPDDSPFFHAVFSRRQCVRFSEMVPSLWVVSPEDIILMKLLWRMDTQSSKQWDNALSVVRVQSVSLDWKYLFEQARALGIEEDLTRLRDEAGI